MYWFNGGQVEAALFVTEMELWSAIEKQESSQHVSDHAIFCAVWKMLKYLSPTVKLGPKC